MGLPIRTQPTARLNPFLIQIQTQGCLVERADNGTAYASMHDRLIKVIGIYHADSGLRGHLRYAFGKITQGEGCALCDITHGRLREKSEFEDCKRAFGWPLELRYRDESSPALTTFLQARTPAVVGLLESGRYRLLMGPQALEEINGDVYGFRAALEAAIEPLSPPAGDAES